jgi:ferredoxin-nitrate reductase
VGGGLVGIEVGAVLCAKGLEVHIVQRSAHLMNKQLDEVAAGILRDELEDRGIHFHFQDQVLMWKGDEWIEELTLASGTTLRDATVIYAMGTVPNVELAGACGLEVNRGVVVDANLRTSDPDILAVGEIAEYDGQLWGTTSAAEEQAAIAAAALAGDVQAIHAGSISQNLLKVSGLSVASIGMARPPADDMSYEEIVLLDRAARIYKKCVVRQDRLVGALLVGDKSDYAQLRALIHSGEELGLRRGTLFRGSTGLGVRLGGRLVCSCMRVDEGRIRKAVTDGARSLADVMKHTTAGSGCGSCRPEIGGLLRQAAAAQNGAVS